MTSPLHVLHVHSGNIFGGIEQILLVHGEAGESSGIRASFALCFDGILFNRLTELDNVPHRLGNVRIRNPFTIRRAKRKLKEVIQTLRPDAVVVHSPWAHALFAKVPKKLGVPTALWLHGQVTGRHWIERLARRTDPDILIANSNFTAFAAKTMFPSLDAQVLYPPVRDVPASSIADRSKTRERLGVGEKERVIVHVGRAEHGKGAHNLVQALANLTDDENWTCWLIGGGDTPAERRYTALLKNRIEDLGLSDRVRQLGQRDDVTDLLNAGDVLCQPHIVPEGFGLVVVEAIDAGLSVVTTGLGGTKEIVDEMGGTLVAPDDETELTSALRRLVAEPSAHSNRPATSDWRKTLEPQAHLELFGGIIRTGAHGR